ncbi:hypothetical protein JCM24511_06794 [Saitozyma sp. JCM 24511]|nr:hypothetical protein JCM24511_06794 [Saitozyma sp. JCM 24511]
MTRTLFVAFVLVLFCAFRSAEGYRPPGLAAKTLAERSFQSGGLTCYYHSYISDTASALCFYSVSSGKLDESLSDPPCDVSQSCGARMTTTQGATGGLRAELRSTGKLAEAGDSAQQAGPGEG